MAAVVRAKVISGRTMRQPSPEVKGMIGVKVYARMVSSANSGTRLSECRSSAVSQSQETFILGGTLRLMEVTNQ